MRQCERWRRQRIWNGTWLRLLCSYVSLRLIIMTRKIMAVDSACGVAKTSRCDMLGIVLSTSQPRMGHRACRALWPLRVLQGHESY